MSNNLVIAQVTDMHIGPSNVSYRNINARQQFLDVLQEIVKEPLDLLVLSGDLAAIDGEPETYAWIRQTLLTFPCPYLVMAGNHDHVMRMKSAFDLPESDISNGMLYFSRNIKGRRLLFLDSSPYQVSKQQLEWLNEQLTESNEPVLLFIHHPPLKCGCQFMDDHHALQNIDDVWEVLDQHSHVKHIFCGHYHTEKTVTKNGKSIYLTPSTVFQIDTENYHFSIDHIKPGWRIIEWKGTQVHSKVEYSEKIIEE
ncbi:metallophosphoesterase [Thiotrichales bacterium HSG14]|nr:metallophosphoesterase [Thiotrichales bacterium HSG14]